MRDILCAKITNARDTPGSNQRDIVVTIPLSQTFRESSCGVIVLLLLLLLMMMIMYDVVVIFNSLMFFLK